MRHPWFPCFQYRVVVSALFPREGKAEQFRVYLISRGHFSVQWLKKKNKKALYEALEKIKSGRTSHAQRFVRRYRIQPAETAILGRRLRQKPPPRPVRGLHGQVCCQNEKMESMGKGNQDSRVPVLARSLPALQHAWLEILPVAALHPAHEAENG
ncbi:hypothetical protein SAY87_012931 [Trapa incisa]|uniref:Uncharacterized protein n=1 Tax=Trapa incisa TaxID=236973 RepID=A0AAN7KFJ6_9MYRT|nr:hypothetical protein SAY87_012931 [Trapa incisa]